MDKKYQTVIIVVTLLIGITSGCISISFETNIDEPPIDELPPITPIKKILAVPASSGWIGTDLILPAGQSISITANGLVDYNGLDPDVGETAPDGDGTSCDKESIEKLLNEKLDLECMMPGVSYGMLVGKIGDNPPFVIGSNYQFITNVSGELYLSVNDCCSLADNTGEYTVTISSP